MNFNESAVVDWLRIGIGAVAFILIGKMVFVGMDVPLLGKMFAAV